MIRAIIFDCFGVVLTDALQAIRTDLARHNRAAAEEVRDIVAANNRGFLSPDESSVRIADILGISVHDFRQKVHSGEVRDQKLLEFIGELKKTYKTAMLSNIAGSSLARRFPNNELQKYFDVVAASADIGYAKPDAGAYLYVCQSLRIAPEECVFTDDKTRFCQAARDVGMQAIVYKDFVQFRTELEALL
ncbi:MAG: HAD-IA family hydrolase [Candidatus Saccharimonadales bacterium]